MAAQFLTAWKSGELAKLGEDARDLILREAKQAHVAAGTSVFSVGKPCQNLLLVLKGKLLVSVTTESGREIVLYHVEPGDICVLTVASLMAGTDYDADGVAESDIDAVVLPKAIFDQLLATSAGFRALVFSSYGGRLNGLIALVQEIAIRQVDKRLARLMLDRSVGDKLDITHNMLASELNTAREVVTRLLNTFEERGWLALGRGHITILNRDEIEKLCLV